MMADTTSEVTGGGRRLVNGVFAGGGAKGIAYAGALKALEERGVWFGSVAGASAGSITAALIAAGMNAREFEETIPEGLGVVRANVGKRLAKAAIGHAHAVFDANALRVWLDGKLRAKIGLTDDTPVTFTHLHEATGIDLYVATTDLVHGIPVVFSRHATPHVEVAGAVAASSAIPAVFQAGRAVFQSPDGGAVVHQLVDGAVWANYPQYIFESSFRIWTKGEVERRGGQVDEAEWSAESDRPTVGFVLGDRDGSDRRQPVGIVPAGKPTLNRRFDRGPTYTSAKRGSYLFGATLSSDWARLFLVLAIAVWLSLSFVVLPVAVRRFSTWLDTWVPDALIPITLVSMIALATLTVAVAVGGLLLLVVAGRLLADTILPSAKAMMGVPTDVPPWVGLGPESIVVFVPRVGLSLTRFGVPKPVQREAVETAHREVGAQLDALEGRLTALLEGTTPPPGIYRSGAEPEIAPEQPRGIPWADLGTGVLAAAVVVALAVWSVNAAGSLGIGWILLAVVAALVAGLAALGMVSDRAAKRAAARSHTGVTTERRARVTGVAAVVVGIGLLIAGLIVSGAAMNDRDDTIRATVLNGEVVAVVDAAGETTNRYTVELTDGRKGTITTDRHLRLDEDVFVDGADADDGWGLVGPVNHVLFGVAITLVVVGLVLTTAGIKRQRLETRNQRLRELAVGWERMEWQRSND